MNKHVLLIGGGGYIGTVVSKYLLDSGCKVRILDNFIYQNFNAIKDLKGIKNFSFFEGNFALRGRYKKIDSRYNRRCNFRWLSRRSNNQKIS